MDFKYDVLRDCKLLEKEKTFSNLYKLICSRGDVKAACWLEGENVRSMTFNELAAQADSYAVSFLKEFGDSGRVCICVDSCKEWFPMFWGLVRSGHDVMAVDASMTDAKVASLLNQAGCKMIISGKERKLGPEYTLRLLSDFKDSPAVPDYSPVWGHNIALCTSGTTSDSKVFVYDEETICYLALFSEKVFKDNHLLIDNKCFNTLAFLPFHHILGFAAIFIWSHFLGYTTVYLKDRAPQTILKTVKLCDVNQIVCVPLLVNSLVKGIKLQIKQKNIFVRLGFSAMVNLSLAVQRLAPEAGLNIAASVFGPIREKLLGNKIYSLVLGGSHTAPETLRILNALGYYTICGYGMTETAITGFETTFRLDNRLLGSIGEPMAYTEYKIKEGGDTGELMVRGKGIHDGRFIDGQMVAPDTDSEGWVSTGDIVRFVKSKGQYFIEGRIKDVIINESGENVYPDEMEDAFSNLDGVQQYCILGLARKADKGRYEDISLVLNVADKLHDDTFISELASSIRSTNETLPVFKRLSRVLVTSEKLPVANGFKVKRQELRRLIENGALQCRNLDFSSATVKKESAPKQTETPSDGKMDEIKAKISGIYSEVLGIPAKDIAPDSNFIDDLGGDSLQILSLATKAEECFGILIPSEAYISCTTVNGTAQVIHNLLYGNAESGKLVQREAITRFEDSEEYKHFQKRFETLTATEDNPYFVCHDSPLQDTSVVNGRTMLDFGSYNYVCMSGRKEVNDAAKAAIDRWGTSASGSRLLAGEKPVHGELESAIAKWKHAESALVLVGGHSTNVTVVGNFCGKNDLILYDALAHNSIEQGCRLSEAMSRPFPHNDLEALEQILKSQRQYFEKVLVVIEGVYSMDGDVSDVPAFVALKKKYGFFLMVDEAHSACVLGKTGGGVDEHFGLASEDVDIKYGTLSKGLGTCGGYIAGRKCLIDYFRYNLPGFVFSVGMSPALAAGSLKAVQLLQENPSIMESLHSNIKFFADEAHKRNLNICGAGQSAILPVLVGRDEDAVALSNELNRRGILVPPALYPAVPKNKARLRFDVCSEHKKEQIVFALDQLLDAASELGISLPA